AGAFSISGVPAGSYTLSAVLAEYQPLLFSANVVGGARVQAPPAGAPSSARTLLLRREARITGSVRHDASSDQSGSTAALAGSDVNGAAQAATVPSASDGSFAFN